MVLPGGSGTVGLYAANLHVIFFNLSWGPVMWVMLGEMFPNRMRGSVLAIAGAAQWLANFAVSSSFPWLARHAGLPLTYGGYTLVYSRRFLSGSCAVSFAKLKGLNWRTCPAD